LSDEQLARLPELLKLGAEHFGFRGEVWTRKRVASLIEREFGVRYSPRHVGRLLKAIRWSAPAIEAWRAETWPELQKKPRRKDAR
jgi:transposase